MVYILKTIIPTVFSSHSALLYGLSPFPYSTLAISPTYSICTTMIWVQCWILFDFWDSYFIPLPRSYLIPWSKKEGKILRFIYSISFNLIQCKTTNFKIINNKFRNKLENSTVPCLEIKSQLGIFEGFITRESLRLFSRAFFVFLVVVEPY